MVITDKFDSQKHLDEAVELVIRSHLKERQMLPCLPTEEDHPELFRKRIKNLFSKGSGAVTIEDNNLVGFLAVFELDEFFGKGKGIYIPIYGHGVEENNKKRIYREMYKHAAESWVEKGHINHAITMFANDDIDTWFWLGFGLQCVDAIRETSPIGKDDNNLHIKKASLKDIGSIGEIHRKHNLFYKKSPIFIPREDEDPIKDLSDWMDEDDHQLWVACHDSQPIGYMRIEPDGESFVSKDPTVMNITGAYVEDKYRNTGAGTLLLDAIQTWLKDNNYELCGVDFESTNILASNFWNKYFTPYSYTLLRHVDDRIL